MPSNQCRSNFTVQQSQVINWHSSDPNDTDSDFSAAPSVFHHGFIGSSATPPSPLFVTTSNEQDCQIYGLRAGRTDGGRVGGKDFAGVGAGHESSTTSERSHSLARAPLFSKHLARRVGLSKSVQARTASPAAANAAESFFWVSMVGSSPPGHAPVRSLCLGRPPILFLSSRSPWLSCDTAVSPQEEAHHTHFSGIPSTVVVE